MLLRPSVRAFRIDEDRQAVAATPKLATVATDLVFHFSHGSRHLGMIEGLRGVLGLHGTARRHDRLTPITTKIVRRTVSPTYRAYLHISV